jgi:hypothetical protein
MTESILSEETSFLIARTSKDAAARMEVARLF